MQRNAERRRALGDAGIRILAREGGRGLTHRAVDRLAEVPIGTTANYARSRALLITLILERVAERLAPSPGELEHRANAPADAARFRGHLRDLISRLLADADAATAMLELRFEARRRPEVAVVMREWRAEALAADQAFHASAGLPGGAEEIALAHYAIEGLLLDRLTDPLEPDRDPAELADRLAGRIIAGL